MQEKNGGSLPLEFNSLNHGRIAFGFFNIETDLLLMEHYFFFAPQFSHMIEKIGNDLSHKTDKITLEAYSIIDSARSVGNLMGAIRGVDLHGFIGEVYRKFPFPKNPEQFKQKPYGAKNRDNIEALLKEWASPAVLPVRVGSEKPDIMIGEFLFSKKGFYDLIAYVWHGGMPGWEAGVRPEYISKIKEIIDESTSPLLTEFKL